MGGGGIWAKYVNDFKARVIADGGSMESPSCAKSDVKFLVQNPEPVPTPAFTGLLNDYSGAAAAYSLRLLDNTYSGNAVKVRRSSDNAEQDIAFVNNELDTASLETFAGSGDAFVTTWYDQSGNANDAAQANAVNQPKIVSSGSTILENGKAAMLFDEGDEYFAMPVPASSRQDFFVTLKTNDTKWILMEGDSSSEYNIAVNSTSTSSAISSTYGSPSYYKNGVLQSPSNRTDMYNIFSTDAQLLLTNLDGDSSTWGNQFDFGFYSSSNALQGYVQEAVYYNSNQSSNRTGIETNINDFYSIY